MKSLRTFHRHESGVAIVALVIGAVAAVLVVTAVGFQVADSRKNSSLSNEPIGTDHTKVDQSSIDTDSTAINPAQSDNSPANGDNTAQDSNDSGDEDSSDTPSDDQPDSDATDETAEDDTSVDNSFSDDSAIDTDISDDNGDSVDVADDTTDDSAQAAADDEDVTAQEDDSPSAIENVVSDKSSQDTFDNDSSLDTDIGDEGDDPALDDSEDQSAADTAQDIGQEEKVSAQVNKAPAPVRPAAPALKRNIRRPPSRSYVPGHPLIVKANDDPSNPVKCSTDRIYEPGRLHYLGRSCKTVTGRIVAVARNKSDGDYHAFLDVDPQFRGLLKGDKQKDIWRNFPRATPNFPQGKPYLIIEDVCHYKPASSADHDHDNDDPRGDCGAYRSPFPVPGIGRRYQITGNYVLDGPRKAGDKHTGWAELHGLTEVTPLP